MFGFQRVVIAEHERGLQIEDGMVRGILMPGVYHLWNPLQRRRVQLHDTNFSQFRPPQLDVMLSTHKALCEQHFHLFETNPQQLGVVYKNDQFETVLEPETRALYWKAPAEIRCEIFELENDFSVPEKLLQRLNTMGNVGRFKPLHDAVNQARVPDHHLGLLFVNDQLQQTLNPGFYGFWRFNRKIYVEAVDMRLQMVEVQGQDILSKDKVSLRLNLSASYKVTDAVKARVELGAFDKYIYRALQFALRQAVGMQTLDQLLSGKDQVDSQIFAAVSEELASFGIQLVSVGLKDIILPGEMKMILNQVVEAEKLAQANVIKRREETAATRSLLNTAKLMDENPTLLRLKELETLEKVTDKIGNMTVFGGLEGVLTDLVRIGHKP